VFPEPNFAEIEAVLQSKGFGITAVSAANMRHVVTKLNEEFDKVRAARASSPDAADLLARIERAEQGRDNLLRHLQDEDLKLRPILERHGFDPEHHTVFMLLEHLERKASPVAMTDEQIDAIVKSVFPPDRDSHYDIWLREVGGPIARAVLAAAPPSPTPIDMVLFCPKCGVQHIDAPDHSILGFETAEGHELPSDWTNPPHRSHLCSECGHVWRPADVPTNGVAEITTKGKVDSPLVAFARCAAPEEIRAAYHDAAVLAELENPQTSDWVYDDRHLLADAIRKRGDEHAEILASASPAPAREAQALIHAAQIALAVLEVALDYMPRVGDVDLPKINADMQTAADALRAALSPSSPGAQRPEKHRCSAHPYYNPDCQDCVAQNTSEDASGMNSVAQTNDGEQKGGA
jgi:hypothetical protein